MLRRHLYRIQKLGTTLRRSVVKPIEFEVVLQAKHTTKVFLSSFSSLGGIPNTPLYEHIGHLKSSRNANLIPMNKVGLQTRNSLFCCRITPLRTLQHESHNALQGVHVPFTRSDLVNITPKPLNQPSSSWTLRCFGHRQSQSAVLRVRLRRREDRLPERTSIPRSFRREATVPEGVAPTESQ